MAGLVCGNCGATNPAGSRFCATCDGFLDWEGQPAPADTAPEAPARPQPARPANEPFPEPVPPGAGAPRPAPPVQPAPAGQPAPAVRHAPQPAPEPFVQPTATAPDDGILRCPHCGTANPPGRRFCRRCGDWLVTPGPPVDLAPTAWRGRLRGPWWKRPFEQKAAYTTPLTTSTVVFRAVAVVASLAAVSLLLGVFGFNPVGRARDYVQHLLGSGRVEGVEAAADPAGPPTAPPPAWAVDDVRGRAWTTSWVGGPADVADACASTPAPAVASRLVLTFPGPTDVREIGVEAGLAEGDKQRGSRYRPRTLRLDWAGGECQSVRLDDAPGLQRFGVRQGDVTGVTVTVVSGYAPASASGTGAEGNLLDVGEVTLWRR
jgi:hypothetical protein